MSWVAFSVAASLIGAVLAQANHVLQLRGAMMVLTRAVFAVLVVSPLVVKIEWPTDPHFYMYMAGGVLSLFVGDMVLFDAARKLGGRLASIFLPIKIYVAFIIWALIDPSFLQGFVGRPIIAMGVLFCLGLTGLAMAGIKRSDTAWPAMKMVFPVGIAFGLADIFIKLGLRDTNAAETSLLFVFMMNMAHIPMAYWFLKYRPIKKEEWPDTVVDLPFLNRRRVLIGGILVGGLSVLISYCINMGIGLSPNPGYVGALTLLTVVWLSIYNRLRGIDDRASFREVGLLVASSAGIILLVN